ncbi:pentapeptide repeat-containing protein [Nocardia tengchongensis]|uniref:pentapeptide repeat-containing protein n=1 Tax=Nocardia tengchongensis TaxID=2055889 RepID=UPI00360E7009
MWALVIGVGIAALAYAVLKLEIKTNDNLAAPIDITKLALTVVGGVGGAVALVVAYRRQRDLEQNRFVERFGAAAAQLGSASVAVRIAGVYAMAGVADESTGSNRQQCIDVLCGYLRLPYDPAHGGSGRTKRVTKTVVQRDVVSRDVEVEQEEHAEYRQDDREVRQTIIRVIADHLRADATHSWSENAFDFRTARLESADFSGARFMGIGRFAAAVFSSNTDFAKVVFSGDTDFAGATFSGNTSFEGATFSGNTSFEGAIFSGTEGFMRATFSGTTSFIVTVFAGATYFTGANFAGDTHFATAIFAGDANFMGATFAGATHFAGADFAGDTGFTNATFSGITDFTNATFSDTSEVSFVLPEQWDPAPVFDWDGDSTQKPDNVWPRDWPPTVWAASPATA